MSSHLHLNLSDLDELKSIADILPSLDPLTQLRIGQVIDRYYTDSRGWPKQFINRATQKPYTPHNDREAAFVYSDGPWRYGLLKAGEGSGKSTAGIIKDLNRVRRGMSGMAISPNLPHLQRSLWKEFVEWCPWDCVIPAHRRMGNKGWIPRQPFDVVFDNGSYIHFVGAKDISSLEGPNLSWTHFDEARHFPDGRAVKVLDGRCRIEGSNHEPPQLWFTTTPDEEGSWLYTYFGPLECDCKTCGPVRPYIQEGAPLICPTCNGEIRVIDPYAAFKHDSMVVTLSLRDNAPNLSGDFIEKRAQSLTEAEALVYIEGQWGRTQDGNPFIPSMIWWDHLQEEFPPLTTSEPIVLALDAATGRQYSSSDCFAIVGVTRHPDPSRSDTDIAVRYTRTWQALPGQEIDYIGTDDSPGPETVVRWMCDNYSVVCVCYDPAELHSMVQRLTREQIAWFEEIGQTSVRQEADRNLLNLIQQKRLAHTGDYELRQHMKNADRKLDPYNKKLRIVKRTESQKIDLVIALSMASYQCLKLNL